VPGRARESFEQTATRFEEGFGPAGPARAAAATIPAAGAGPLERRLGR